MIVVVPIDIAASAVRGHRVCQWRFDGVVMSAVDLSARESTDPGADEGVGREVFFPAHTRIGKAGQFKRKLKWFAKRFLMNALLGFLPVC